MSVYSRRVVEGHAPRVLKDLIIWSFYSCFVIATVVMFSLEGWWFFKLTDNMFMHCALGSHLIGANWFGRVLKTIAGSREVYVTGMPSVRRV